MWTGYRRKQELVGRPIIWLVRVQYLFWQRQFVGMYGFLILDLLEIKNIYSICMGIERAAFKCAPHWPLRSSGSFFQKALSIQMNSSITQSPKIIQILLRILVNIVLMLTESHFIPVNFSHFTRQRPIFNESGDTFHQRGHGR